MAATESGLRTTLSSSRVAGRAELVGPGTTLAEERLLPVVPALEPLLPGRGLRRGTTVTVTRSAALALALVTGASAAGSWVAAVGLPDLGIVAAAETGIVLERLAMVPVPGARAWPAVVAAFLDAVDVVLVRSPPRLPAGQGPRARSGPRPHRRLVPTGRPAPGRHLQHLAGPRPGPRPPPSPPGRSQHLRPRHRHPRTPVPPLAPIPRRDHHPH